MTPSHATKPGRRYRYYVTRTDQLDGSLAWRVSAYDLEQLVCERLSALLMDQLFIAELSPDITAEAPQQVLREADLAAAKLRSGPMRDKAEILAKLLRRIDLRDDGVDLMLDRSRLVTALGASDGGNQAEREPLTISLAAVKVRRGHQLRLVIPGPGTVNIDAAERDEKLVALVAEEHHARALVLESPGESIAGIAAANKRCRSRLGKLAALGCLAPDIATAIVEGRQPTTLTVSTPLDIELPLNWAEQRTLLGFC